MRLIWSRNAEAMLWSQVACGARHTVFQTACGAAFACGWGKWGQLGTGDADSRRAPVKVVLLPGGSKVEDIACGWWSSLLSVR